jgi:hypothetical protein
MNNPATWVDVAIASTFPLALVVILINRWMLKRGIGVRIIQFAAVALIVPAVVLLARDGHLQGEAVAAIFGGLAGYLFANISKFDERDRNSD